MESSSSAIRLWRPIKFYWSCVFSCLREPIWDWSLTFSCFCPPKLRFSSSSTLYTLSSVSNCHYAYLWASIWRFFLTSMLLVERTFSSCCFSCLSICTSRLLNWISSFTVLIISCTQSVSKRLFAAYFKLRELVLKGATGTATSNRLLRVTNFTLHNT